jgi:hypothetical protein
MEQLTDILVDATAHIEPVYFRLPIDGGGPIYRERVYCYELYHQMRLRWPRDARFTLNGEVDKIAHPILSKLGADYAKPDLLVHGPGDMRRNHAIIEVKSLMADHEGIRKDLNTLQLFRTEVGYERAIHLIYGSGRIDRVLGLVERCARQMGLTAPVEVWVHLEPGHPAEKVLYLGGRPEPTGSVTA